MKYIIIPLYIVACLFCSCSREEASEYERTLGGFIDDLGTEISPQQWWETAVNIRVNVVTDTPIRMWLLSTEDQATLYDYKEISNSGTVMMTAPQGEGSKCNLVYMYDNEVASQEVVLTGAREEIASIEVKKKQKQNRSPKRVVEPAGSLNGHSVIGRTEPRLRAEYYEFEMGQLLDFFHMMNISKISTNAKDLGLNVNYELISNGPFTITWVNGYEADQKSHILGYYYHTPGTYSDIQYVDLSETHKWDYIDGLAKVQYKLNKDVTIDGHTFNANVWYDANFDRNDDYGSDTSGNPDRLGDRAYNMQAVFNQFPDDIEALRGISFDIDVPVGKYIGFYLRSDEEASAEQWERIQRMGVAPYTKFQYSFMGTCFSAEALNIDGTHRSFVMEDGEVIWMGMEDIIDGGDLDCNDIIFGVVTKVDINYMPDIIIPNFFSTDRYRPYPWTLAFEDVNRGSDFDFNDAVIRLMPDYANELCCVKVMAAGSTARMYLHYDGPEGDMNLGEIHELLADQQDKLEIINTTGSVITTPFVDVDCVPWPNGYSMANDASRFYIEVQRGTCDDCTDVISLPTEPGLMPEALLVVGEWKWPKEGVHIFNAYPNFSQWAKDVTRTRFWEWHKTQTADSYVSY